MAGMKMRYGALGACTALGAPETTANASMTSESEPA